MSNKYPKGHAINNPDIGTDSDPGLKGMPRVLPKPKPKKKTKAKEQYAYGGKKIKMAKYYSSGGTVYTGRD